MAQCDVVMCAVLCRVASAQWRGGVRVGLPFTEISIFGAHVTRGDQAEPEVSRSRCARRAGEDMSLLTALGQGPQFSLQFRSLRRSTHSTVFCDASH